MWEMDLQQYMRASGYSIRTISSYLEALKRLCKHFDKDPASITEYELEKYLSDLYEKRRSPFTLNQYHMSLKLLKIKVLALPWNPRFVYSKRHKRIPVILSREEISELLRATKNNKHKLILALSYGAGLRVSEVVNIRVKDIDTNNLCMTIVGGKGSKDRISVIPEKMKSDLLYMIAGKDKEEYLFKSERGGKLTTRSAQMIMNGALRRAKIMKGATFHSLRHSFATHLLENGVDIRYIQKLLGHASITTTQLYTKVTNPNLLNIRSPLT